jgi:hypothetical protein
VITFPPRIFDAVAAYLMNSLCIVVSVRSGIVQKRKDSPDVINAMIFTCHHIENFPMTIVKKVILRAIPFWREVGTDKWIQDEESRYICPNCGNKVFRGAVKCNDCKEQLDLD